MIANFFQSLENNGVAYLLISGQATVLYGAAVFSEDIDLWVKPTESNTIALLTALRSVGATYYKLTPPLEPSFMFRGHGFHFFVPNEPEFYLDIMGQPPRVPTFDDAMATAIRMPTTWGVIPVIGIKHLAALKTTQRLGDYPIISQLAIRYLEDIETPRPEDYRWALDNIHTIDELEEFARISRGAETTFDESPVKGFISALRHDQGIADESRIGVERWLSERILACRQLDREYWQEIIAELRELRSSGQLMPVGSPV